MLALKKGSADPVVTKILRDHPDLREWEPWPLEATAEAAPAPAVAGSGGYAGSAPAAPVARATIKVEPVWKLTGSVASLLDALGMKGTEYWTQEECVDALKRYADSKQLWRQNNRKRIGLDDLLMQAACGDEEDASRGFSLEGLADHVLSNLKPYHRVTAPQGGAAGGFKVSTRPGKPPNVSIKAATRRGHPVTLAVGLEAYGVDLESFAGQLQKSLAASTAVETAPQLAVMVQGFLDEKLTDKVMELGVPAESIQNEVKKGQHQKKTKQATNIRKT